MQGMTGVKVHPFMEPHFNLALKAKAKANDTAGAEALKRQYLKARGAVCVACAQGQGEQRAAWAEAVWHMRPEAHVCA